MLHQSPGAVCFGWREQQVYVIGHQHIGVYGAAKLVGKLFQVVQVELVVLFGMKADGAIVAALNDVPSNAGEGKAGAAGHEGFVCEEGEATLAENNRGLSRCDCCPIAVVCPLLLMSPIAHVPYCSADGKNHLSISQSASRQRQGLAPVTLLFGRHLQHRFHHFADIRLGHVTVRRHRQLPPSPCAAAPDLERQFVDGDNGVALVLCAVAVGNILIARADQFFCIGVAGGANILPMQLVNRLRTGCKTQTATGQSDTKRGESRY